MTWPRWVEKGGMCNLREVAPNLYLGGIASFNIGELRHGIRWALVLDVASSDRAPGDRLVQEYNGDSFPVWAVVLKDGEAIPEIVFDQALSLVSSHMIRGPVLIQCQMGLSRSASLMFAMLRVIYGLPSEEALRKVQVAGLERFPVKPTLASAMEWSIRHRRD